MSTSRAINALERKGLVVRERRATDRSAAWPSG
ncbi:MAG: hypothetical protein R3E68_11915 [Burkholderiaceae bacterium]